jgi:putative ABC transport system permease protein
MTFFCRVLYQSFLRQRRRKLLAGISIALGVTVATAMIAVATDIGDKINRELRSYGANLVVYPEQDSLDVEVGGLNLKPISGGSFLKESDLVAMKTGFWKNNIVGYSPMLPVTVEVDGTRVELIGTYFDKRLKAASDEFTTGVRITNPWWKVTGSWPDDTSGDVLVGERLAQKLHLSSGESIRLGGHESRVSGILSSGGNEDDAIVASLQLAQEIAGKPGLVRRVLVSALTKPEDELARRDPEQLKRNPELFDRWYCSPYANSIAYELQSEIPHSKAEQIRQVAQNEGSVLSRIQGLMLLVTLAALAASALAVSAAMTTAVMERRGEVGLMKAIGAGNFSIGALFFVEAAVLALVGGLFGYFAGLLMAQQIGHWIFNATITIQPVLLPVILGIAVIVTFVGSAASILKALRFEPVLVLRGDA